VVSILPHFQPVRYFYARAYLKEKLEQHFIFDKYVIDVGIREVYTNIHVTFDMSSPAIWKADTEYAWFTVNKEPGGCDAYFHNIGQLDWERWNDEFSLNTRAKKFEMQIRKCLEAGAYWVFRRSAGQGAIINLSYGLIAAAYAKITNGIVFTDDSAWDYDMFPTSANQFLQDYFNTSYVKQDYANWAKECLEAIKIGPCR
jgi:hypothetical protein